MEEYKELNTGHALELADRLSIIMGNLDEYCYNHPAADDKMQKYIDKAMKNLWEAYQEIGKQL